MLLLKLLGIFLTKLIQNEKHFAELLLDWYGRNKRELPWRNTTNPYIIWLSEIILQQTRINQGLPYFNKFLEKYPNVEKLASADEQSVLRLWQGLGYYSRAKNLHACAKVIASDYQGSFPDNYNDLLSLKGVGKYTAAAIASFAFDEKVAVVDGNVFRVLSRVFGMDQDISSPQGQNAFRQLAETLLPEKEVADYNQAIMEFGALHCTPANPDCESCVFNGFCFAYKHQLQNSLPVKIKKVKVKSRYLNYFVIRYDNRLLMKKRNFKDIWNGLYDFYLVESEKAVDIEQIEDELITSLKLHNAKIENVSRPYKHILTHQKLYSAFYLIDMPESSFTTGLINALINKDDYSFYTIEEVINLPKPILINKYLSENIFFD